MIGCLRTRVRKQPIIALYLEFETVLMFYNLEACMYCENNLSFPSTSRGVHISHNDCQWCVDDNECF